VTLVLSSAGAVLGAALGVLAIGLFALIRGGVGGLVSATSLFPTAGTFGATVGAILGPVAGWLLLRHIPLGRAIAHTAAGTVLGILAGYALAPALRLGLLWPVCLGLVGFLLAAVRLRFASPLKPREENVASADALLSNTRRR
jgi:NhaP-type Na+/H+ or K+/H+ antiporter